MKNDVFRKAAIDRISAPDQMNDYIKAAPAGAWSVLVGGVFMLAGALFFLSTTDVNLVQLIFG